MARYNPTTMDPVINFCCTCGQATRHEVPAGDSLPRHVCPACGVIQYQNPRMVVGTLALWEDRILLCRRAIEPRHGKWTLPGGFMENGESVEQAAIRETREEACAAVELDGLYAVVSLPFIHQVHFFYRARILDGRFDAGEETLEAALFREQDIPWEALAFRTVDFALKQFFADRRRGQFQLHSTSLTPPPGS